MASFFATLSASFTPLKDRNFRIYLSGQAISLIGTWLQASAQQWVVWKLTGSSGAISVVTALSTLPLLFLAPWTGVWADRLDRRKLLIVTQIGAMLLAFILAFLTQTELIQLWHVYALSLILGVITALDMPAQQAFLGDLSGLGEIRKAVNLNIMFLQVSRIFGPAIAGFVIGALGAAPAFWLNGLSFLAVIATLVAVRANQLRAQKAKDERGAFRNSIRFVRSEPRMMDLFIFAILVTFFGLSIVLNILPAVADTVLKGDASIFGWLQAASGAGALFSVLVIVPIAQSLKRTGLMLAVATIWLGVWVWVFSLTTSIVPALLAMFLISFAPPTIMTTANGLVQLMSPPAMRARILTLFLMVSFGIQPIAALLVGFSADHFGIPTAIAINGIGLIVGGTIMLARRAVRDWESNPTPSEPVKGKNDPEPLPEPIAELV